MKEETSFPHLSKRNQFLILSVFFLLLLLCFLLYFFKWLFFPSKHIKIIFKIFKLILIVNLERKVGPHHMV